MGKPVKNIIFILLSLVVFSACAPYYGKVLKSPDYQLKLMWADQYYEKGDYARASTLYEDVAPFYRGTEELERILYTTADCAVKIKDYETGGYYYKQYATSYPKGAFAEESRYMIGYCYYMASPDAKMDQTNTLRAIEAFALYMEMHPYSPKVREAVTLTGELQDKLAYKALLNTRLYYNLGDYMGNNYRAAVITATNALDDFPNSKYREEFSFIILKSKYKEASMSVAEKILERFVGVVDEYYNYIGEYPNTKNRKEADKMFAAASKYVVPDVSEQ